MKQLLISLGIVTGIPIIMTAQWNPVNTNTLVSINAVCFKDSLHGYFVGGGDEDGNVNEDEGVIFKTMDGGENWVSVYAQDSLVLNYLVFRDTVIYAFGIKGIGPVPVMLRSYDDGVSWSVDTLDFLPIHPQYFDNDIWYYETTDLNRYDNGNNVTVAPGLGGLSQLGAFYINNNHISTATSTYTYQSADFGITWDTVQFTTSALNSGPYHSYYDGSDTMVTITKYPGSVHYSIDAGITWNFRPIPDAYYYFLDANTFIGVNRNAMHNHYVYTTTNMGLTIVVDTLTNPVHHGYIFSNTLSFVFGSGGTMYKSNRLTGTTGLHEQEMVQNEILIYPNPAQNTLNIIAGSNPIESIRIYNSMGQLIREVYREFDKIDISTLPDALYLISVETNSIQLTRKFVKK